MPDIASQNPEPSLLNRLFGNCCHKRKFRPDDMTEYFGNECTEYEYIIENLAINKAPKKLVDLVPVHTPMVRQTQQEPKQELQVTSRLSTIIKLPELNQGPMFNPPTEVYFSNVYSGLQDIVHDPVTLPNVKKTVHQNNVAVKEIACKYEKDIPTEIKKVIDVLKTKPEQQPKLKRDFSAVTTSKETCCDFGDTYQNPLHTRKDITNKDKLEITNIFPERETCEEPTMNTLERNPSSVITDSVEDSSWDSKEDKILNNLKIKKKVEKNGDKKHLKWKIIINKHTKDAIIK